MASLWDDLQAGWNACMNGIEHPDQWLKVIDDTAEYFAQQGIAIEWDLVSDIVRVFADLGVAPFEVIPMLADRIWRRGGNVPQVLRAMVQGISRYGAQDFAQRLHKAVIVHPLQAHAQRQAQTAMSVGAILLETSTGMDALLGGLYGSSSPRGRPIPAGAPFQGPFANDLLQLHTTAANNVDHLAAILHPGATIPRAYDHFTADIDVPRIIFMAIVAILLVIVDLIMIVIFLGVDLFDLVENPGQIGDLTAEQVQFIIEFDGAVWDGAGHLYDWIANGFKGQSNSAPSKQPTQPTPVPVPTPSPPPGTSKWLLVAQAFANALHRSVADVLAEKVQDLSPADRNTLLTQIQTVMPCDRAALDAYLSAHANVTIEQLLQALNAKYLAAQYQTMKNEMQAALAGITDPSLRQDMQSRISDMDARIQQLNGYEADCLNGTDRSTQLATLQNNLRGDWAEWKAADYYLKQGKLLSFGRTLYGQQVDLVVKDDNNNIHLIQVKYYTQSFTPGSGDWRNIQKQAMKTVALASNPNAAQYLKTTFKLNGNVTADEYLINDPNTGSDWSAAAGQLAKDAPGINVYTTTPDASHFPGGNALYQQITTPPLPPSATWCSP